MMIINAVAKSVKKETRMACTKIAAAATAKALVTRGNKAQQTPPPPYTVERLGVTPNPKRATPFLLHAACSHIHETYHGCQALIEVTGPNDDLQEIISEYQRDFRVTITLARDHLNALISEGNLSPASLAVVKEKLDTLNNNFLVREDIAEPTKREKKSFISIACGSLRMPGSMDDTSFITTFDSILNNELEDLKNKLEDLNPNDSTGLYAALQVVCIANKMLQMPAIGVSDTRRISE